MALTVFYNTKCPVCDAGISRQKTKLLALLEQDKICFEDINFDPDALKDFDIGIEDIRKRLHALTSDGKLLVGADVAIAIWAMTPKEGWLAKLFGNRFHIADYAHCLQCFAELLYFWNIKRGSWAKGA